MNLCERCKTNETKVRLEMETNYLFLCMNCYNALVAEDFDVDLEQLIESFSLKDYQGISRTFYVERRLFLMGMCLEATENTELGYKFAVLGEIYCDQQALLNKLIQKTQKGIRKQHVKKGIFPNGQAYNSILNDQFIGLIEYDEESDGTPLVIIDGKPFTWEEVGKMLMAYEGFQIKLEIHDVTDDVE